MPSEHCSGRTVPLTSKRCILYIYSTNIGTEYFKHGIYSSFFSHQNAVCFIILTYLVPVLFAFYIQGVLKLKNNSGAKRLKYLFINMLKYVFRVIRVSNGLCTPFPPLHRIIEHTLTVLYYKCNVGTRTLQAVCYMHV
jgi:hypothetical protein